MFYLNKTTVAGPPKNDMEATYKTHPLGMHLQLSLLFLYSATGATTTKTRSTLPIKQTNGQTNKQTIKQTTQSNKESNKQTNQTNKPINQSNKQAKTNIDKQLAISFSTFNSFGKKISSSPPDPGDQQKDQQRHAARPGETTKKNTSGPITNAPTNQPTNHNSIYRGYKTHLLIIGRGPGPTFGFLGS